MKLFLYICLGSFVGILATIVVGVLLMLCAIQLGISTSHPAVVFLVQAIAASGWLIGILAALFVHFRKYHIHRRKLM
jgi:membrane associated rhomboid family serine protease